LVAISVIGRQATTISRAQKSVINSLADTGQRAASDTVSVANGQLMIGRTRRHLPRMTD
jgi:hypothetical protein